MGTGGSLRERTRERMRDEVTSTAMRLFLEKGFDAVTTAEIANESGISPRSFFRYFETKEDVVLSRLRNAGGAVRDALVSRPPDESVWESLRIAFRQLIDQPVFAPAESLDVTRLIMMSPSIQARSAQKRHDWEDLLLAEITARLPPSVSAQDVADTDRARALLAAGLACVDSATRAWLSTDGQADPVQLLDTLMGQLHLS